MKLSELPLTQLLHLRSRGGSTQEEILSLMRWREELETSTGNFRDCDHSFYRDKNEKGPVPYSSTVELFDSWTNFLREAEERPAERVVPQRQGDAEPWSGVKDDTFYLYDKIPSALFSHQVDGHFTRVKYHSRDQLRLLLMDHTAWFPRLKRTNQQKLLELVHVREDNGFLDLTKLRRVLEAVDHIVIGYWLAGEPPSLCLDIQVSVVSNLVHNGEVGYMQYLKGYKKVVKLLRKFLLSAEYPPAGLADVVPREYSWMCKSRVLKAYFSVEYPPAIHKPWRDIYPLMVILQTRSTGLANEEWSKDSLSTWTELVTSPSDKRPFSDEFLRRGAALSEPLDLTSDGVISLVSSGSVEFPRAENGKFEGLYRDLIQEILVKGYHHIDMKTGSFVGVEQVELTDLPALPTGWKESYPPWLLRHIGQYVFEEAVYRVKYESYPVDMIKVSSVIEQGKTRTVSPNSLYHYIVCSPFGHITLRALATYPETKVGVSQSDDAWQFYQGLHPQLRFRPGEPEDPYVFICADLETATDWAPHELPYSVVALMKGWGIPSWYLNLVGDLLGSPRRILTPDGKRILGQTESGLMMGDSGTKTILTLAHYWVLKSFGPDISQFAIKGDDVIAVTRKSRSRYVLAEYRRRMELTGFKLSELDTFISPEWGFYCEGVFRFWSDTTDDPRYVRATLRKDDASYGDLPLVKLAFPVFRDNRKVGETPEGKMVLLSKRSSWFKPNSLIYFHYQLLGLIQRKYFMSQRQDLISYIPSWRGGLDCLIPFDDILGICLPPSWKVDLYYSWLYASYTVSPEAVKDLEDHPHSWWVHLRQTLRMFVFRGKRDDEGGPIVCPDIPIPGAPIWDSDDEAFWSISLRPILQKIKGISSLNALKAKYITLLNLSGSKPKYVNLDEYLQHEMSQLLCYRTSVTDDEFLDAYRLYCMTSNYSWNTTDWSLYRDLDDPVYASLRVSFNPQRDARDWNPTVSEQKILNALPYMHALAKDSTFTQEAALAVRDLIDELYDPEGDGDVCLMQAVVGDSVRRYLLNKKGLPAPFPLGELTWISRDFQRVLDARNLARRLKRSLGLVRYTHIEHVEPLFDDGVMLPETMEAMGNGHAVTDWANLVVAQQSIRQRVRYGFRVGRNRRYLPPQRRGVRELQIAAVELGISPHLIEGLNES